MRADLTHRPSRPPRGLLISTGTIREKERILAARQLPNSFPQTGHSYLAENRTFPLGVDNFDAARLTPNPVLNPLPTWDPISL
jgi:hypothetical protein